MTSYFRRNQKPAPLPSIYFEEDSNTSHTNLYAVSEAELNNLGFFLAPDPPSGLDPFYQEVDWSVATEEWFVVDKDYETRRSQVEAKLHDHIVQWNKLKRSQEIRLITLDYQSDDAKARIESFVVQIRNKITALQAIEYVNYEEVRTSPEGTDNDYNEAALNFQFNEPNPALSRLQE